MYAAEHVHLGTPAAIKVLTRGGECAKARFNREAKLLATLKSPAFPRFFACGDIDGTEYIAMELLEPGELPKGEKAISKFLLNVCDAVSELHGRGLVHRDIKPANILWRRKGKVLSPVLADLGLVKDAGRREDAMRLPGKDSIVTFGGVGTPGYGAPEQMERGEATVASDIHSLGVLADHCFEGKPPRVWLRIIERATSSIPMRRFSSVAALARAIRCRHMRRDVSISVLLAIASLMLIVGVCIFRPVGDAETKAWRSMCERTDIETVENIYESLPGTEAKRRRYRVTQVTNVVKGTIVRLPPGTQSFSKPILLDPGEYRIVGPGRLDADVSGSTNVVVRLKNCVLNNMTEEPYPKNGIRYILEGGAYLNFARLKDGFSINRNIKDAEGNDNFWEFSGPLTKEDLAKKRLTDSQREFRREIDDAGRESPVRSPHRIY